MSNVFNWIAGGDETAGNSDGSIRISKDGSTWTSAATNLFGGGIKTLLYDGAKFIAAGRDSNTGSAVKYSTNGSNWLNATSGGFTTQGNGIDWNGSFWVAVGTNTNATSSIQISTDGANWTPSLTGGFNAGNSVAFSKNSALVPDIATQGLNFYLSGQPEALTATNKHQIRTTGSLLNVDYTVFINKNTHQVGINTPNPQASLDVAGSVFIQGSLAVSTIVSVQSVSSIVTLTGYGDLYYNPSNRTIGYSNTLH
jgi:hypothetical protein